MKYFEGVYINGWFGDFGTWIWIGLGWVILSIITSLVFGFIARIDRGENE